MLTFPYHWPMLHIDDASLFWQNITLHNSVSDNPQNFLLIYFNIVQSLVCQTVTDYRLMQVKSTAECSLQVKVLQNAPRSKNTAECSLQVKVLQNAPRSKSTAECSLHVKVLQNAPRSIRQYFWPSAFCNTFVKYCRMLLAGQKYCRMLQGAFGNTFDHQHSAILLTFIKLPFVIPEYLCFVYFWVAILIRFYCIFYRDPSYFSTNSEANG